MRVLHSFLCLCFLDTQVPSPMSTDFLPLLDVTMYWSIGSEHASDLQAVLQHLCIPGQSWSAPQVSALEQFRSDLRAGHRPSFIVTGDRLILPSLAGGKMIAAWVRTELRGAQYMIRNRVSFPYDFIRFPIRVSIFV